MKDSILKRIEAIEKTYKPNPLEVLCVTEYGEEVLSVSECVRRGAEFRCVVSGTDLRDLDVLLSMMRESAEKVQ